MYGSLDRKKRKVLWNDFKVLLAYDHSPCVIIGDFNAIFYPHEKKSMHSAGKRYNHFSSFVESYQLQDLGFVGPLFTWQRAGTHERLDRALANDAWISAFP